MQVSTEVLQVLSGLEFTPNGVRIVAQLDRKLYVRTNEVLEAAGGKWSRRAKIHEFASNVDPSARIDEISSATC